MGRIIGDGKVILKVEGDISGKEYNALEKIPKIGAEIILKREFENIT